MRKVFSIVFLALLTLNILGYYGVFFGLHLQNDHVMTQKLDEDDYDRSEAITVKIPITIPYATDSRGFERVNGTFEHQGEFYRLVKQRLTRDTLHIVCVKDHQGKKINQAIESFVKTFTDKPVNDQQNTQPLSDFIKDYLTTSVSITSLSFGWQHEVTKATSLAVFLPTYNSSIVHPPERA